MFFCLPIVRRWRDRIGYYIYIYEHGGLISAEVGPFADEPPSGRNDIGGDWRGVSEPSAWQESLPGRSDMARVIDLFLVCKQCSMFFNDSDKFNCEKIL